MSGIATDALAMPDTCVTHIASASVVPENCPEQKSTRPADGSGSELIFKLFHISINREVTLA